MPRRTASLILCGLIAACSGEVETREPQPELVFEFRVETDTIPHAMMPDRQVHVASAWARNLSTDAVCYERPGWGESGELRFYYPTGAPVAYVGPCDSLDFGLATCPTSMRPYRRVEPGSEVFVLASNNLHRNARFELKGALSYWACDEAGPPADTPVAQQAVELAFDFPDLPARIDGEP